jgi:glycerol-3-phosphate O-acyltransferase/dihydroxyacetone phosphate acyltransferase
VGYRLVRGIIRILLWLFYRRIEIVGRDRVPSRGPVIVAPNHHNALVDAMLVVAAFDRPIRVLAKSTLFSHPLIGPFLWLMGAVPVRRRIDLGGDDPGRNADMFASVVEALRGGGVILIFPEGRSQPQPKLLPLRSGTARIVLDAERSAAGGIGVALVPVGLVFHDPGTFRSASALVKIGPPVPTADALRLEPEHAVRLLTDRLSEAIRAQMVEAEDQHTLELLAALETAWWEEAARRGEAPAGPRAPEESLTWRRDVARAAARLAEREPDRVTELRRRLEEYCGRLDEVGITSGELGQPYTVGLVSRYVVENLVWLALGLPLAVWGIMCHLVPYWLTARVVPLIGGTEEEEATDKIAAGAVLHPVCWLAEGWLIWRLLGPRAVVVFAALLIPSGLLALAWAERLDRVARQARAFFRFLVERDLHQTLMAERRALVDEMRALAARVPGPAAPGGSHAR